MMFRDTVFILLILYVTLPVMCRGTVFIPPDLYLLQFLYGSDI